jgi:hypothetical protein
MTVIGIDPGANGSIAWQQNGKTCVEKTPETLQDLFELLHSIHFSADSICRAFLEQVHSSPQMGVKSAFTFGNGFGHLEMGLTAAGIPFERVRPQVWQKTMQCMSKGDKNVTKRRAQELFPDIKVTHATADGLLIMSYGLKQ